MPFVFCFHMSGDAPLFLGVYIHRMINYKTSNFFILVFFSHSFLSSKLQLVLFVLTCQHVIRT